MKDISRREFIKRNVLGLAAVAVGLVINIPGKFRKTTALAQGQVLTLEITEVLHEMVDETLVYSWAFSSPDADPGIPGPVIFATEGDQVEITIINTLDENHAFAVSANADGSFVVDSGPIAPNDTAFVTFEAPAAGTYIYLDPLNSPVNRVLGLHGVLVVLPVSGNTPYSNPTPSVQQLFNDLGTAPLFPGNPWNQDRTLIWVFTQIDPFFNAQAQNNQPIDPDVFVQNFLPRYFTINGLSGFFSAHDPDISPRGFVGEPELIRNVNVGLATHSPHIHGNHVYQLSINGQVQENVLLLDTWTMSPLDRRDVLLPFIQPPDIPAEVWPPRAERFPLEYPMHCHTEMSQTSGGGNYPQGLITDWVIEGPLQG